MSATWRSARDPPRPREPVPFTTAQEISALKTLAARLAAPVVAATALTAPAAASAAPKANPVIAWDRTTLQILRAPGVQPATIHPTRALAMVSQAMWNAVDGSRGNAASPRAALACTRPSRG